MLNETENENLTSLQKCLFHYETGKGKQNKTGYSEHLKTQ